MDTKYLKWSLIQNIDKTPKNTNLIEIIDNSYFLKIKIGFDISKKVIKIIFDKKKIINYRVTSDESYLSNIWLDSSYKKINYKSGFYIIQNSKYKKDYQELDMGFHDYLKPIHYAIYTIEDCIDILALEEPEIKILS